MAKELELFSLDGLGGWFRRSKPHAFVPEPGQKCLNCDTELAGRFCHACGQDADTHHRSIFHLIAEAFEGLFHLDGRIWQTLPPLF
ncbi:MAG: 3'-5' exonuclease, partial [Asticcacaulis sp.]|nr:3'-5' exonuclease [Asticcacaulis sp.]